MKLATFLQEGAGPRIGTVIDDTIVDITGVAEAATLCALIEKGETGLEAARRRAKGGPRLALCDVRLLAPIPRPPEFLGVGLNYPAHIAEIGLETPKTPTVFNKQTSSIAGPFDDIVLPAASDQLDYEAELGLVIGAARRHMSRDQAQAAIFGYLVVNDLSVRDWQLASPTVTLGKSFDTHGPIGPWIVTADELDAGHLNITTKVDDEVRQQGSTSEMIFDCAHLVAYLSEVMSLAPGVVVATGTPAGVGHCRKPNGYLRAGQTVSVEIDGIGRIANKVVPEERGAS